MLRVNFIVDDKLSTVLDKLMRDATVAAVLAGMRDETLCLLDDALTHDCDVASDVEHIRARLTALAVTSAYVVMRSDCVTPSAHTGDADGGYVYNSDNSQQRMGSKGSNSHNNSSSLISSSSSSSNRRVVRPRQLVLVVYVSDAARPRERMLYSAGTSRLRDVLLDSLGGRRGSYSGSHSNAESASKSSTTVSDILPRVYSSGGGAGGSGGGATSGVHIVQCNTIDGITTELLLPSLMPVDIQHEQQQQPLPLQAPLSRSTSDPFAQYQQQLRERLLADREALMTESERAEARIASMEVAPQPVVMPGVPVQFSADVHDALEAYARGTCASVIFRLDATLEHLVVDTRLQAQSRQRQKDDGNASERAGRSDSRHGGRSGSRGGSRSGSRSGSRNGGRNGGRVGSRVGKLIRTRSGGRSGGRSGSRSGSLSGSLSGSRSGSLSGSRSGSLSGSRSGSLSGSRSRGENASGAPRRSSSTAATATATAALQAAVPRDHARFVVTHYSKPREANAPPLQVMALVCPAVCPPRERMAYAAAKAAFLKYTDKLHVRFERRLEVRDCDELAGALNDLYNR